MAPGRTSGPSATLAGAGAPMSSVTACRRMASASWMADGSMS